MVYNHYLNLVYLAYWRNEMNDLQKAEFNILKYYDEFTKKHNLNYFLFAGTLLGAIRHEGFIPWDDDIDVAMKRTEFEKFEKLFIDSNYEEDGYTYQSRKLYPYQALALSKIRSKEINMVERMPNTQKGNYGPWIDVFPFDNIPDDEEKRIEQYKKVSLYNELIKKLLLVQVEPEDKGLRKTAKRIVQSLNENLYQFNLLLPYLFKKRHEWMTRYNNTKTTHSADISYMQYKDYNDFSKRFFKNSDLDDLIAGKFEGKLFSIPRNYDEILTTHYGEYMTLPEEADRKVHKIEYLIED